MPIGLSRVEVCQVEGVHPLPVLVVHEEEEAAAGQDGGQVRQAQRLRGAGEEVLVRLVVVPRYQHLQGGGTGKARREGGKVSKPQNLLLSQFVAPRRSEEVEG